MRAYRGALCASYRNSIIVDTVWLWRMGGSSYIVGGQDGEACLRFIKWNILVAVPKIKSRLQDNDSFDDYMTNVLLDISRSIPFPDCPQGIVPWNIIHR
jgi:hypothetical protein